MFNKARIQELERRVRIAEKEISSLKRKNHIRNKGADWPSWGIEESYYTNYDSDLWLSIKDVVEEICKHLKLRVVFKREREIEVIDV